MLVLCGAAGCIGGLLLLFALKPASAGNELFGVSTQFMPSLAVALILLGAIACAVGVYRRLSLRELPVSPKPANSFTDDLVGMLDDTLKIARPPPVVSDIQTIEISEFLQSVADRKDASRVTLRMLREPMHALAGSDALARAVEILIENALSDGNRVVISSDRGSSSVVVHVDDDGPGIDRKNRERVFDWRYYLSTPPSQRNGCNAELVIARRIMRSLGGDIVVSSSPLGGARFTVRLPLRGRKSVDLALAS